MTQVFNPSGTLNVSWDAADLPGEASQFGEVSGAMTRCKNLRINQQGQAKTRDGSTKLSTEIETPIYWLEEMAGTRYAFASDEIYENETSLATGLMDAQWAAIQYNAFNDTTNQIFALNGTDRKRITAGAVNEWGIAAPTVAPTLGIGEGSGLTGEYNAKYTYVRKIGELIVAESNPSPAADSPIELDNQSLTVDVTQPTDSQVTHIRMYRTLANGGVYFWDLETAASQTYTHGYSFAWEATDAYISGTGFKFTITDSDRGTENTQTWEATFETLEQTSTQTYGEDGSDPTTPRYWSERFPTDTNKYQLK